MKKLYSLLIAVFCFSFSFGQKFDTTVTSPFGLSATPGDTPNLEMADMDGDGDIDLFIGDYDGDIYYYENISRLLVSGQYSCGQLGCSLLCLSCPSAY